MSRSLVIGISVTILLLAALASLFYWKYVKIKDKPATLAIPDNAAVIIESDNISLTWAKLRNSDLWKDLDKNDAFRQLTTKIIYLDSLFLQNEILGDQMIENKTTLSFHSTGNTIDFLAIAETDDEINMDDLSRWISSVNEFSIHKRLFEKQYVYDLVNTNHTYSLTLAYRDRLLICSPNGSLVEEAIRKLKYKFPNKTEGFTDATSIASASADMNVYINYHYLPLFLSNFLRSDYSGLFGYLKHFANWSMLDVNLDRENLSFSGITYTDDSLFQYLDLFKSQSPVVSSIDEYLPGNTALKLQLGFSNYAHFYTDFTEYLQINHLLDDYHAYNDSLEKRYNIDIAQKLIPLVGENVALGTIESGSTDIANKTFAVIRFKDTTEAITAFNEYVDAIGKRGENDSSNTSYNGYNVRRLMLGNFMKLLFGKTFEVIYNPYYTSLDGVFIFANDLATLKSIVDQITTKDHLLMNESYKAFLKKGAKHYNLSVFMNTANAFQVPANFASEDFYSIMNRYSQDFKKFEFIEVVYTATNNNAFHTNLNIQFNPSFKEETRLVWNIKLDTSVITQPYQVYNSSLKQNCVLVQDVNNTLYYINNTGQILWKTTLSAPIISPVYQADPLKNRKIQYLFNTSKQAYLIDEDGNNAVGFPVRFPGIALNSVSLIDIYGDSSFTWYVPLDNKRIAGYDLNGKPIKGWNPLTAKDRLFDKLELFTLGKNHYLYTTSEKGELLLYSPKGESLKHSLPVFMPKTSVYYHSDDTNSISFFGLDSSGSLVKVNCTNDLNITEQQVIYTPNSTQQFKSRNTTGGDRSFFIFHDSVSFRLVNEKGKLLFEKHLNATMDIAPGINYARDNKPMVTYIDLRQKRIHWFDTRGRDYPTFPLNGTSSFSTGNLMMDNNLYLLCGDAYNKLKLYRLK